MAPAGPALFLYFGVQFATKSLLAVPAGVVADRLPRASIYAWMRAVSGVASLVALLAFVAPFPLLFVLIAAALASGAHAFDLPAHRALQCEVQPQEHLERGLSFGSTGFHVAALLAPIVAFPLWTAFGPTMPLLISAVAFFVASVPAFGITPAPVERTERAQHAGRDIGDALRFVTGAPVVVALLLVSVVPPLAGKVLAITLPSASGHEGDASFGLVLAATEFGAISAALLMTTVTWRFSLWLPPASAVLYAAAIAAACVVMPLGAVAIGAGLFIAGCAKTMLMTSAVAGISHHTPREIRGRLMTI